ncbi:CS1 type fimbrial major subunit [Vibrio crassostreae]|uniref:CS1 type fimbrial major subunit n=1 Tax=Vibrio crassostreae TaxID=246167 RepID=UPI001B304C06|nr:CS1 type fimbrial major subunit [Vibrio crassostreae]CAK3513893.1 CS1 type fimbrial major subunit [Vibrio crassostreae]CAK3515064.1 CS1 type fimbrial major subunit [Vibrio crassostreae]CAK3912270.1 CS1 type fimbrial major subunit [Vibrio crassostreae]
MKKIKFLALPFLLVSAAQAAETTTITLSADVPSETFHFRPITPISGAQEFDWDLLNEKLKALSYDFSYNKGDATNSVTAKIASDVKLTNGADTIPVAVTLGSVTLTTTAQNVVEESDAAKGSKTLTLTPNATGRAVAGTYSGTVEVTLDAVAKVTTR